MTPCSTNVRPTPTNSDPAATRINHHDPSGTLEEFELLGRAGDSSNRKNVACSGGGRGVYKNRENRTTCYITENVPRYKKGPYKPEVLTRSSSLDY